MVLVRTIDSLWVEHLTEIDDMRRGIGLRGYAQQDPLNEFRREAFDLYEELRGLIRHGVASSIFRVTVTRQPAPVPGGDPAVAASLAAGAAALSGGNGRTAAGTSPGAAAAAPVGGRTAPPMPAAGSPGSAIVKGALPAAPKIATAREQLGDAPVAAGAGAGSTGAASGAASASGAPALGSPRAGRGSAATTRAGAAPAPSTRSATAAERLAQARWDLRTTGSATKSRSILENTLLAIGVWPRILGQACHPGPLELPGRRVPSPKATVPSR